MKEKKNDQKKRFNNKKEIRIMPCAPLSSDHVTNTFAKNSGNLLDSIWYGIQYKKMVLANQNI